MVSTKIDKHSSSVAYLLDIVWKETMKFKANCFSCNVSRWWASHNEFDRHGKEMNHPVHMPSGAMKNRMQTGEETT